MGVCVGALDGCAVGAEIGDLVGIAVGAIVGSVVGTFVGDLVGETDVGCSDGISVGPLVGCVVGSSVGDLVGSSVIICIAVSHEQEMSQNSGHVAVTMEIDVTVSHCNVVTAESQLTRSPSTETVVLDVETEYPLAQ